MGRDLKVHYFKNHEEYNHGNYNYNAHENDFSRNGERMTEMPWAWEGSPMDLANTIAKKSKKLKYVIGYCNHLKIEKKAKVISCFAQILSECSEEDMFIVIRND